jgi:hypothetical protein
LLSRRHDLRCCWIYLFPRSILFILWAPSMDSFLASAICRYLPARSFYLLYSGLLSYFFTRRLHARRTWQGTNSQHSCICLRSLEEQLDCMVGSLLSYRLGIGVFALLHRAIKNSLFCLGIVLLFNILRLGLHWRAVCGLANNRIGVVQVTSRATGTLQLPSVLTLACPGCSSRNSISKPNC